MIELADRVTHKGHICLYNTGEESLYQVRRVTKRLDLKYGFIPAAHRGVDEIIEQLKEISLANPGKQVFLIQDSLQCLEPSRFDPETGEARKGRPKTGLNAQVEAVATLTQFIKETFGIFLLIGQVTKDGTFAGKNEIKHIVDCHLHLGIDTDRKSETYGERVAEMLKNRFGPAGQFFGFALESSGLKFEMGNSS
jgi:DNA repair protein RadA/Sms